MTIHDDSQFCVLSPDMCPIILRVYVLIDLHEDLVHLLVDVFAYLLVVVFVQDAFDWRLVRDYFDWRLGFLGSTKRAMRSTL